MRTYTPEECVEALTLALAVYSASDLMTRNEARVEAFRLHRLDFFGPGPIATICGLGHRSVSRWGYGTAHRGGRFSPHAISTMLKLAKLRAEGAPPNKFLVRTCIEDGCSASLVSKFTGYPAWAIYEYAE